MADEGDDLESLADEVCLAIAESFVMAAVETMMGDCANAGQFSIVSDTFGDFFDQIEDISNGDFSDVDCSHPEAAGEIMDDGNSICQEGADTCQEVRDAFDAASADLGDIFDG